MPQLDFTLHDKQLEIFKCKDRFRVCGAGRRGGKSFLSAVELLIAGLQETNEYGYDIRNKEVWYVAPTFQQAKDIMWNLLKDLGEDVIESTLENVATLKLINGRTIKLKGSDRPDTLRGVGVSFVVMDEYAFMKNEVWDLILRPTLSDVKGRALFIGTPEGKNHFYDLWMDAQRDEWEDWSAFQFNSTDNPMLDPAEIENARVTMTPEAFRQEYEASFESGGGSAFDSKDIKYVDEVPGDSIKYITVDPAGFGEGEGLTKSGLKRLDEMAIAVVTVNADGWFVDEIISGRWGIREASLKILRAAQKYQPAAVGIESGSLRNALMPYLEDQMRRLNIYPRLEPLTHGGKKKTERITWALQGRFSNGRIHLKKGDWNKKFVNQLLDFPNPLAHDDLIDALAYIDQISVAIYDSSFVADEWEPLDELTGI